MKQAFQLRDKSGQEYFFKSSCTSLIRVTHKTQEYRNLENKIFKGGERIYQTRAIQKASIALILDKNRL